MPSTPLGLDLGPCSNFGVKYEVNWVWGQFKCLWLMSAPFPQSFRPNGPFADKLRQLLDFEIFQLSTLDIFGHDWTYSLTNIYIYI